MIAKSKLRSTAKRPLTLWAGRGGRRDAHIFAVCFTFSQFFFLGGGGGGAIFALAISGQLKCYLSPSHLHLRYLLVSRALARNLLPGPPPPDFSQAIAMQAVLIFEICFLLVIVKLYVSIVG